MRWVSTASRNVSASQSRNAWALRPLRHNARRCFGSTKPSPGDGTEEKPLDPRMTDLGHTIKDDFAKFQEKYNVPKHPIVLAHGLMGFDELRLVGKLLPGVQYWRGITEAMRLNNIEVITTAVPTTGSIEERAHVLHEQIKTKAAGKDVNIIAHSMGGLDARYLISKSLPSFVRCKILWWLPIVLFQSLLVALPALGQFFGICRVVLLDSYPSSLDLPHNL